MIHGEEKARDMTRSLLPSRHRASARYERATIHRSARRQSRVELAQLARDAESHEDLAGLDDDVKEHRGDVASTVKVLRLEQRMRQCCTAWNDL